MLLALKWWKEIVMLGLAAAAALFYWLYTSEVEQNAAAATYSASLEEALQKSEQSTTETVKVTHKVITRPDGTKEVVEEKVNVKAKVSKKSSDKKTVTEVAKATTPDKSRYLVGVLVPNTFAQPDWKHPEIQLGARLGNSPAFGIVQYRLDNREISLGVQVEF